MKINSVLKDLLYYFSEPVLNNIIKFENIHKGEDCYLFGDGVSIKYFDLNKFSDKISIICGKLFYHNKFDNINAKYILGVEPHYLNPFFNFIQRKHSSQYLNTKKNPNLIKLLFTKDMVATDFKRVIYEKKNINFFLNYSNYPFTLNYKNVWYLFRQIPSQKNNLNFITNKISSFNGSIRASILLAILMGFKTIYMVGFDYTHNPARSGHWYEKHDGIIKNFENYQKDFFFIAKKYINLINITLDGNSHFTDSIQYEKFFGAKPKLNKNYELVSQENLNLLSTSSWLGYKIF